MNVPDDVQERVGNEFIRRYPEFYASANNAKLLSETVTKMTDAGSSFSVDTLASAYHHLQALGALQEPEQEIVEMTDEERARHHHIDTLARNAEIYSDFELEKNLRSAGIYVRGRSMIE